MNCWPILMKIISNYFSFEKDGGLIGFWSTAGNFGTILGSLVPSLMIINAKLPWQISLLLLSLCSIISITSVSLFV